MRGAGALFASRARGHGGGLHRGDGKRRAPATVRRYVSSVATVHRAAGEQSPLEHVTVRRALKRMYRHRGYRQTQVQGLTWALRRRLLAAAAIE